MASRFWLITAAAVAVVLATWAAMGHSSPAPPLRSEHSQPVISMPAQEVAVAADGKLFHKPSCRYIHGKPQMMSAEEAAKKGYTPDPRCLKKEISTQSK